MKDDNGLYDWKVSCDKPRYREEVSIPGSAEFETVPMLSNIKCAWCGRWFVRTTSNGKYCSADCSYPAGLAKQRERDKRKRG